MLLVLHMQVDILRKLCLEQMLYNLSSGNILSFASVADRLGEETLVDACLEKWATSPDWCALSCINQNMWLSCTLVTA